MFRKAYRLFRPMVFTVAGSSGLLTSYFLLQHRDALASIPAIQYSVYVPKGMLSYCDTPAKEEETSQETPAAEEELLTVPEAAEAEEEEWIAEKEKCSFCKHFMLSPCREQFKKWSKCVDLAKTLEKDFVKSCAHYTRALMACTTQHSEYFSATRPDEGDDVEDEEEPATASREADSDSAAPSS